MIDDVTLEQFQTIRKDYLKKWVKSMVPMVLLAVIFPFFNILAVVFAIAMFSTVIMDKKYRSQIKAMLLPSLLERYGQFEIAKEEKIVERERYQSFRKKLEDGGKNMAVLNFAEKFISGFSFITKEIDEDVMKELMAVLPKHDVALYDDYFSGDYKGIKADIVDMSLSSGSGDDSKTVFKGVVLLLTVRNGFKGKTVVSDKKHLLQHVYNKHADLARVTLEDTEFNDKYFVYGSDQVEARTVLTPSFMERLKFIDKKKQKAGKMDWLFWGNRVAVVMRKSKDSFEVKPFLFSAVRSSDVENIVTEFDELFALVDDLRLS